MIVMESCPMFPAASWADTVTMFAPSVRVRVAIDHDVVPVAVPEPPVLQVHVTEVTPTASDAVPDSVVIGLVPVAYVASDVGPVIVHTGAVVSEGV